MVGVLRAAEESPGFVWRLRSPGGHADGSELLGLPGTILNVSVWADYESLHGFTYRGLHGRWFSEREQWFEPVRGHTTVLWWIPAGQRPDAAEAGARLSYLRRWGPSPRAFPVLHRFTPAGEPLASRTRGARSPRGAENQ
jgi:hypothetical protein